MIVGWNNLLLLLNLCNIYSNLINLIIYQRKDQYYLIYIYIYIYIYYL